MVGNITRISVPQGREDHLVDLPLAAHYSRAQEECKQQLVLLQKVSAHVLEDNRTRIVMVT